MSYGPVGRANPGEFRFRLILPYCVKQKEELVTSSFKGRNKLKGALRFIGRDEEAEKKCRGYKYKPTRIFIYHADGEIMTRLL